MCKLWTKIYFNKCKVASVDFPVFTDSLYHIISPNFCVFYLEITHFDEEKEHLRLPDVVQRQYKNKNPNIVHLL